MGNTIVVDTPRPSRLLRAVVVVLALGGWFGSQYLIRERPPLPREEAEQAGKLLTANDGTHIATAEWHRYLWENRAWSHALLIVSSAIIDVLGIFLLVRGIVGPSIRPVLGLILLFAARQLCQGLNPLPAPEGMIWEDPTPGFRSTFLVTYDVANDFFFSGHTALAVFGAIEVARLGRGWLTVPTIILALAIAGFESLTVLMLRAHYTMDVYAGAITAVAMALLADRLAPWCDRWLTWR